MANSDYILKTGSLAKDTPTGGCHNLKQPEDVPEPITLDTVLDILQIPVSIGPTIGKQALTPDQRANLLIDGVQQLRAFTVHPQVSRAFDQYLNELERRRRGGVIL